MKNMLNLGTLSNQVPEQGVSSETDIFISVGGITISEHEYDDRIDELCERASMMCQTKD